MSKEDIVKLIGEELEKNNFPNKKDKDVEKAIISAIKDDCSGNLMAMTVYGLLDGKLSSLRSDCEKLFL